MANETNTTKEILVFEVDQGKGLTDLEKMRKTLIGLKEEQKSLNDAYKKGTITQEEYVKEITRVDTLLKKVSTSHLAQQKAMAGVQTETSKLIKSNQQLSQSLKDSVQQINIAGVNVGQLGTKISALANPITATVAIVGALGAAYARSTIGAKDLAFASSQLSAATTILTNDFAKLISSAEDGEGALTKVFNEVLSSFGPAGTRLAVGSKGVAMAQEILEDLLREEVKIRGQVSDRLAENQELLTSINDEQASYESKLQNVSTIIGNLRSNQKDLLENQEQQLDVLKRKLAGDTENEELQTAVLEKEREISKTKSDTEKKIQAILRLEDNIRTQNEKQAVSEAEKTKQKEAQTSELERQARIATLEREQAGNQSPIDKLREDSQVQVQVVSGAAKAMGDLQEELANRVEKANARQKLSNETVAKSSDARLDSIRHFTSVAASLYQAGNDSSRKFAALQLAIDAGLTLAGINAQAAGIQDPKQANVYKAAAILSAGASLAQAAKLIGAGNPTIDSNLTPGSPGYDAAVASANKGQGLSNFIGGAASGAAAGAALGSIIPGVGTVVGGIVGGLIGGISGLFRKKKSGFASGGWTGPGDTFDVAGVVHADEYVAPKRVVNSSAAAPHIRALEEMRVRGYANGGYVSSAAGDSGLIEALRNATFEVSVVEISNAQAKYKSKVSLVTK